MGIETVTPVDSNSRPTSYEPCDLATAPEGGLVNSDIENGKKLFCELAFACQYDPCKTVFILSRRWESTNLDCGIPSGQSDKKAGADVPGVNTTKDSRI